MGKIFTYEEVKNGHLPKPENFDEVALEIARVLEQEPKLVRGQFYGSYGYGRQGTRSDIDFLVLHEESGALVHVCQELRQFGAARFVPVNFTFQDIALIHTDFCQVGVMLQRHLSFIPEGMWVKGNPLDFFSKKGEDPENEFKNYLKHKIRKLEEIALELTLDNPLWPKHLQKVLEAPIHIARKILMLEGKLRQTDSRHIVHPIYMQFYKKNAETFERLMRLDNNITTSLISARMDPSQNLRVYKRAVEEAISHVQLSINFARWHALNFNRHMALV